MLPRLLQQYQLQLFVGVLIGQSTKKRAKDKDGGAFCAAGPEKSSGDCYFSHVDAVREMNGWSIESRRKVVGAQ